MTTAEKTIQAPDGTAAPAPAARPALTSLSDEEALFAESVREFAEGRIGPRVREMDERGELDCDLLRELFGMGLMGIELPEPSGGAGANFMMAILAVEELSRVDPSVAVVVDVQNTLVNNAL
ncbi:MAG: acyl-CoA dehydrogenase family protein, partial [Gemmatimonadota bacterium]